MAKVKIGFAGAGFMGQVAHLQNYVLNPDCEVVALAEPRHELARLVAEKYDIPRVYSRHTDLIDDPEVEAVVASQPFLLNGYIVTPLLRAGKHCFIEKPMAGSLAEAEAMVEAAEAGGALLMVGFMKRYDDGVNRAKAQVDAWFSSGTVGELGMVNAYCLGGDWIRNAGCCIQTDEHVPDNDNFVPQRPDWMTPAQCDTFDIYMNIFSHNVNLMRYLCPYEFSVRHAVLQEGSMTQSTTLTAGNIVANLHGMQVASPRWQERTELYFDKGWARVVTPTPLSRQESAQVECFAHGDTPTASVYEGEPYWAFRAQADHFVECVREGKMPRSNGRDSLEDMRLMEDVFRKATWI
jgi:predicted dehydrogenase